MLHFFKTKADATVVGIAVVLIVIQWWTPAKLDVILDAVTLAMLIRAQRT